MIYQVHTVLQHPDIGYLTVTEQSSQYLKILVCLSIPYTEWFDELCKK